MRDIEQIKELFNDEELAAIQRVAKARHPNGYVWLSTEGQEMLDDLRSRIAHDEYVALEDHFKAAK